LTEPGFFQTSELQNVLPDLTFEALPEKLRAAAANAGWTELMPVQARALPYLHARRNMMVQARTGSGKTGAFLLPMLERLDAAQPAVQALILVPTRELAQQVFTEAEKLFAGSGLRGVAVYGGVSYGPQISAIRGGAQIVVGTPGRILDHLIKRTFTLERLQMLIFDEADRMLSMGFYPDMKQIQRHLPKRTIHTCMFSATFPVYVLRAAREFMQSPEFLSLSRDHVHVTEVDHIYYEVPRLGRERSLVRLIEAENPDSAIIFCNTKADVHFVTVVLQRFGYDADELSADLSQKEREKVLNRVRKGKLRFLVATDVAARGLDIPELSHVIQYEPPQDVESYIHRAGRTGRAGASGIAITLASVADLAAVNRVARHYSIEMEKRELPSEENIEAIVAQRLTALLEARLRGRDKLQTERSQRFEPLARALIEAADELPIITMLLDDTYQQMLHAPVVAPEDEKETAGQPQGGQGRSGGRRKRRGRGRRA
jgi:ATP-dependent RNA helicase DeaD